MLDGVSNSDQLTQCNRISFITFNYDRFLESWLFNCIKHSFTLPDEKALDVLSRIPIYHIYGTLGEFKNVAARSPFDWAHASKGIRTIFETEEHDQTLLAKAKDHLSRAQRIGLLGFGFHSQNIDILDLVSIVTNSSAIVASSRFGIMHEEWIRYTRRFPNGRISVTDDSYKCLGALRNFPSFF